MAKNSDWKTVLKEASLKVKACNSVPLWNTHTEKPVQVSIFRPVYEYFIFGGTHYEADVNFRFSRDVVF